MTFAQFGGTPREVRAEPPGSTIVTLMPSGATSRNSTSEKPSTPHFAAEYGPRPGGPILLLRLSLQLTADAENAETCIILAMRDCFFRSSISRDRVQAWARPQNVYPLGRWFSRLIHLVVAMNLVLLLRHE